jgi:TetR/AcrR family transcriptional regulator, cholesterol catabolism regulator
MRESKRDRILDVAIELAEAGGYDNVRQRDVAAHAGVALGTLYKRFRSKEDILCAALERETGELERRLSANPIKGDTPFERLSTFFRITTRGMCRKPSYARAVLRAVASGEPEIAGNVAAYQGRMNNLIIATLRGPTEAERAKKPSKREASLALLLQQIWFASLVGWSAGLVDEAGAIEQMQRAAGLLIRATDDD